MTDGSFQLTTTALPDNTDDWTIAGWFASPTSGVGDKTIWRLNDIAVQIGQSADTSTGLVAYYKMDDTSGNIANIGSITGIDGTPSGDPTYGSTGKVGDAITFDAKSSGTSISFSTSVSSSSLKALYLLPAN